MIRILHRYIIRTMIMATLMTALIITSVLVLIMLLGEMKHIGEGDYGIIAAFFYVILRLPNELYRFSPMLLLIGIIAGLSMLSAHKELVVMRASGLSLSKMILSILSAVILMTIFMAIVGEWMAPFLSYKAEIHKENEKNAGLAVVTAAGVWFHIDNNFIHIEHVIGRQLLEGITQYQFDDKHHLQATYYAKSMIMQKHGWKMFNVVKTSFYPDRTQSEFFKEVNWGLKINPTMLNVGLIDPSEMSLPKLAKFSSYLKENGLQATEYQFEFWHRLLQPFSSLVMILLAVPFVIGGFNALTLGRRVMLGIVSGFIYYISNATLSQLCIVFQLSPLMAASLPLLIFLLLGLLLSQRLLQTK